MRSIKLDNVKLFFEENSHVNWALADQVVVSGSNFVIAILLARILGIEDFGVYSLAILVVLFATMIQHALINLPMMSIGPKQADENLDQYYGSVFAQAILFSTLSAMFTFVGFKVISYFNSDWNISFLAWPLTINVFLIQLQDFVRRYFYAVGRPAFSFITDFIRYIFFIVIIASFFWLELKEIDVETVFWISAIVTFISVIVLSKCFLDLSFSIDFFLSCLRRHWKFSKWLTASMFSQWLSANVFIIVAGGMLGSSAVGALKAAQSLLGVTHIVFLALENIVPIRTAKMYAQGNYQQMKRYLINVAVIGAFCVFGVSVVFIMYADFWFSLLFGPEFLPFSYLIKLVSIYYILMAIVLPIRFSLIAMEHTKIFFYVDLFVAILSISSVVYLTEYLEILAAPLAYIMTQFILITVLGLYLRKRFVESEAGLIT